LSFLPSIVDQFVGEADTRGNIFECNEIKYQRVEVESGGRMPFALTRDMV
jgi:hypothetical protein